MTLAIRDAQDRLQEAKRQLLNAQNDFKVNRGNTFRFRVQAALAVVNQLDKEVDSRIAWEKWGRGPWPEDEKKV
mgnify:FL=1|tara:strand:- start:35 stop:256 length:222 start_codon:yes stop_codon:yes gene_type:complete